LTTVVDTNRYGLERPSRINCGKTGSAQHKAVHVSERVRVAEVLERASTRVSTYDIAQIC
jgi:hypothetical protein